MAYFLAPSLVSLRNEINAAHPGRDKSSDGWIGDTSHAARKSDHNPDYSAGGIVRAIDVDKDGIDVDKLLRVAFANPATEYVIWQRKIYTRQNGFRPQAYNGSNPHDKHIHISNRHGAAYESARNWGYLGGGAPAPAPSGGLAPGAGMNMEQIVAAVLRGEWSSGADRMNRLRGAGYNADAVQAEVNRRLTGGGTASVPTPPPPPAPPKVWAPGSGMNMEQIVAAVLRGEWSSGADRMARLWGAGYNADAVQAEVNRRLTSGAPVAPARKSNEEIAAEVIAGRWGNNPQRGQRLQAEGYNPTEIQAAVSARLGGSKPPAVRLSVEVLAQQVIAGQWGKGTERRSRITAAGYNYDAVQAEVNRRL